jgi:hypothetical protein
MIDPRMWFVPVWSGDFRLERAGPDSCNLTVEDPTERDLELLSPFIAQLRTDGLISDVIGVAPTGVTVIPVSAGMGTLGPRLGHAVYGEAETWIALRYADGKMKLETGAELISVEPDAKAPEPEPQLPAKPQPTAAATVRKPARGCPPPTACTRRASQVLRAFSTASQARQWAAEGRLTAIKLAVEHQEHWLRRLTA